MSHTRGLSVIKVDDPQFIEGLSVVCAVTVVHVIPASHPFSLEEMSEDVTKALAEAKAPGIEQRIRRQLSNQWPNKCYSIQWSMRL